jgi:hypothetical protein
MICPAIPYARAPSADQRANLRACGGDAGDIHAPSAYAAYASTPTGRVIAVLTVRPLMPGSSRTGPNPHSSPRPTHPDQIATAAGAAISSSGHRRTPALTGHRRM